MRGDLDRDFQWECAKTNLAALQVYLGLVLSKIMVL